MPFPNRNLWQTAVYWGTPVATGSGGFTYADPVEIDCRWVDSNRVIMASDGNEIVTRAEVQLAQDVEEQGMLFLGDFDDLDSAQEEDPTNLDGAFLIKRFDKVPTIRGNAFFRKAYL